jgi:hypothetical protein
MKIKHLFIVLVILTQSCALLRQPDYDEKLLILEHNLKKWEHFTMEGLASLNYEQYSFRKNFVLRKNGNTLRFDVFDSGFFGLQPRMFVSAYLNEEGVEYRLITDDEINSFAYDENFPKLISFLDPLRLLNKSDEIIKKQKLELDGVSIYFTNAMTIEKIVSHQSEHEVRFSYDHNNDAQNITLLAGRKEITALMIDKIDYHKPEINKLEER